MLNLDHRIKSRSNGRIKVHRCAMSRNLDKLKKHIAKYPAMLSARDNIGNTPLMLSVCKSHNEAIVQFLIDFLHNEFPIHWELAKISGSSVNAQNSSGDTAMHIAFKLRNYGYIPMLLKAGADVNLYTNENITIPMMAIDTPYFSEIVARASLENLNILISSSSTTRGSVTQLEEFEEKNSIYEIILFSVALQPRGILNTREHMEILVNRGAYASASAATKKRVMTHVLQTNIPIFDLICDLEYIYDFVDCGIRNLILREPLLFISVYGLNFEKNAKILIERGVDIVNPYKKPTGVWYTKHTLLSYYCHYGIVIVSNECFDHICSYTSGAIDIGEPLRAVVEKRYKPEFIKILLKYNADPISAMNLENIPKQVMDLLIEYIVVAYIDCPLELFLAPDRALRVLSITRYRYIDSESKISYVEDLLRIGATSVSYILDIDQALYDALVEKYAIPYSKRCLG